MVEPLLCFEKVALFSSCFRDIFLVERGKIGLCKVLLVRAFGEFCTVVVVCIQDDFGKWRTADKLGTC